MSWTSARGLHHCKVRGVVQQNKKKKEKKPKQRDRASPGEAVEPCACRHRLFAASRGRGSSVPPPHFSGPMADRDVTH